MNKLEKLIQELCPKGVEWKELGEVCEIKRGRVISRNDINKNAGIYPVFSSQTVNNGIIGYIDTYDYDGTYVTWTTDGAHAGTVFLRKNIKFSVTNICGILSAKVKDIDLAFLAYIFGLEAKKYVVPGMGNPKLMSNVVAKIKIPIPPLSIQQEIVKILDTTHELSQKLTHELSLELTLRKQQYEYYREQLLSFPKDNTEKVFPYLQKLLDKYKVKKVDWKELGEVCIKVVSGGTPTSNNKSYYGGNIPWLRTQEVDFCDILTTKLSITESGLKNSSAKFIPSNCVIVAMYGATVGKVAINKIPLTTNQACCNLEINSIIANYRYVFYWLSKEYKNIKAMGQGIQTNINASMIKKLRIPIPPLEVQQEIVKILDTFEALTSSLSSALPAEIRLRKQQYEYYREKLLTFEELKA